MRIGDGDKPSMAGVGPGRRRAVSVSRESLLRRRPLREEGALPLLVEPALEGVDLVSWAEAARDEIRGELLQSGGLLFRGFPVATEEAFQAFLEALVDGGLLDYTYRSTPRSSVKGRIFTSTHYPPDQEIPLHNEMSYSRSWPRIIGFFCMQAAETGGETPIAPSDRVYAAIDPAVRERFRERGVMYVRNYGGGFDLPWQEVFQTADGAAVEEFCRGAGISFEWLGEDRLRTRQVCQATAEHPDTGASLWFNQAHLFHVSSLDDELRESLVVELGVERLPRNAYYGDGAPLEPADLAAVREAYRREEVAFPWQQGDILLLDNMLVAHGRRPFTGSRKVVVGMAEAWGG